ncbi:MAG: glycosyltransferase [Anaerolineales bacterium]
MSRIGMNPARKTKTSYRPEEVTVALLTYIPSLQGYFQHRLDVLKLSLTSLIENTKSPCDIVVFDNGSCKPVLAYLRGLFRDKKIDYLFLSNHNLGVEGALNFLSHAVMGSYLAYSNDDVFYYPGWLEEHMAIIRAYPNVGMVSGTPTGFSSETADQAFEKFILKNVPGLEISQRERVDKWEADWARSTGRDEQEHLRAIQDSLHDVLSYRGVKAINSATHFQFVAPKEVIQKALPSVWDGNLMGGVVEMDHKVDAMGFLRLSTPDRVTRHIGNMIDPELGKEAERLGLTIKSPHKITKRKHWLLKIPGSGRILQPLYHWLFKILNHLE